MRLEIAERLRCPAAHASTPLIVVARRTVERDLLDGAAGCPVCFLEGRFTAGDLVFPRGPEPLPTIADSTDEAARDRLRALLGLSDGGGAVLLSGRYIAFGHALAAEVDVAVVCLGASPGRRADGVSAVAGAERHVPFTDGTFRGAALDGTIGGDALADAVRTVVVGGRIVAAATLPLPAGAQLLARDDAEWVAERVAGPGPVVPLRRA